jgi:hypothetical protein
MGRRRRAFTWAGRGDETLCCVGMSAGWLNQIRSRNVCRKPLEAVTTVVPGDRKEPQQILFCVKFKMPELNGAMAAFVPPRGGRRARPINAYYFRFFTQRCIYQRCHGLLRRAPEAAQTSRMRVPGESCMREYAIDGRDVIVLGPGWR